MHAVRGTKTGEEIPRESELALTTSDANILELFGTGKAGNSSSYDANGGLFVLHIVELVTR